MLVVVHDHSESNLSHPTLRSARGIYPSKSASPPHAPRPRHPCPRPHCPPRPLFFLLSLLRAPVRAVVAERS
eukprot:766643-Hanusia_phi.AAC.12